MRVFVVWLLSLWRHLILLGCRELAVLAGVDFEEELRV